MHSLASDVLAAHKNSERVHALASDVRAVDWTLDDPGRVIGALADPLLVPNATERDGYVLNVLYTCGGIVHGDKLVLPYGFSDGGIAIAVVSLPELLSAMT